MVDLDSSPTKLIDIVRIGKQLLMTRGSLTTFSIANDVAKYFAIIPALFMGLSRAGGTQPQAPPPPQSAVLSAIIYNALIIIALILWRSKGSSTGRFRRESCSATTCCFTVWAAWRLPSCLLSSSTCCWCFWARA